jgi:hypothetical protein
MLYTFCPQTSILGGLNIIKGTCEYASHTRKTMVSKGDLYYSKKRENDTYKLLPNKMQLVPTNLSMTYPVLILPMSWERSRFYYLALIILVVENTRDQLVFLPVTDPFRDVTIRDPSLHNQLGNGRETL